MNFTVKSSLPLLVSFALASTAGWAQEEAPKPGLYTTVDEAAIYIIEPDGTTTDVKTGESILLSPDGLVFIDRAPAFLNWPCGTGFAGGRGGQPTVRYDRRR